MPIKKVPTLPPIVSSTSTSAVSKRSSFNEKDKGNLAALIKTPIAVSTNKLPPKPVLSASSPKPVLSPRESTKSNIGVGAPIPIPRKPVDAVSSPIVKKSTK